MKFQTNYAIKGIVLSSTYEVFPISSGCLLSLLNKRCGGEKAAWPHKTNPRLDSTSFTMLDAFSDFNLKLVKT